MQNKDSNTIKEYLKERIRQHKWRRVLTVLSCVVVFCTTYALILPALTMSKDTYCGMDEHEHSDTCFEQVLVCTENADDVPQPHEHTADCYELQQVLTCEQEFNEDGTAHIHSDACYQEEQVLICPLDTSENIERTEHNHTEACYTCGDLICQKPEHTHTLQCHSNPDAVDAPDTWASDIPAPSGDTVSDLISVAESQIGYKESAENYIVNDDNSLSGYTKYGAWYGGGNGSDYDYANWSASFVSFCLNKAGIPQSIFPYSADCENWVQLLADTGRYQETSEHSPQAGDIVFLRTNGDVVDLVGIVTRVDDSVLTVVEGDLDNAVGTNTYDVNDARIAGYGILPNAIRNGENLDATLNDAISELIGDVHETVEISVTTEASTIRNPATADDGTLLFYTGESAVTTLTVSNPTSSVADDGAVVRLYMKFSKSASEAGNKLISADGTPSMATGSYTVTATSGAVYQYIVTRIDHDDNTYTYCFEVQRPINGDTFSIQLPSGYPSPTSAGGTNEIWGVILTQEEKESLDQESDAEIGIAPKPADGKNQQTVHWDTCADDFQLTKNAIGTAELMSGENGAYITGLNWKIDLKRASDTLEGIGKDHLNWITYTDTLTLPDGANWNAKILQCLKDGTYKAKFETKDRNYVWAFYDADGTEFLRLKPNMSIPYPTYGHTKTATLLLSEDERQLIICWDAWNEDYAPYKQTAPKKEIEDLSINLILYDRVIEVANPSADAKYIVHNEVSADQHFSWSADQQDTAQSDVEATIGAGRLSLKKALLDTASVMGESCRYQITVSNPGVLSYDRLEVIEDTLPNGLYLSGDDIAELLTDTAYGKRLTIQILDATIHNTPDEKIVSDTTGKTAGTVAIGDTSPDGNSNKYNGCQSKDPSILKTYQTITLCAADSKIQISYNGTVVFCDPTGAAVQTALENLGFAVVPSPAYYNSFQYKLSWDMRDSTGAPCSLNGGESLTYDIPCTVQDTFMAISQDTVGSYPSNSFYIPSNTVYAYGSIENDDGTISYGQLGSANTISMLPSKDFYLGKNATNSDGKQVTSELTDGEIIDYSLTVSHYGTAQYDILPLVDHMSGAQVLLASVEENNGAEWAKDFSSDDIIAAPDGTKYYKLSKIGSYQGVWLNGNYADSVTITKAESGLDTLIKWYFSDYGGNRQDTITYKALYSPSEITPGALSYALSNECWLNDHETHRLYAAMPGITGSLFKFDKKIVSETDITANEKEVGVDNSAVGEGEIVYYRFGFYPNQDGAELTITGRDISDALPLGLSQSKTDYLKWQVSDSNTPGSVWIIGYQGYTELVNGDHYRIEDDKQIKNQQYIRWDDDFSLTVGDTPVYVYVRLTFPAGADWEEYAAKYSNTQLENSLYVQGIPDTVTHNLKIRAKAYLQKGVYTTEGYSPFPGAQSSPSLASPIRNDAEDTLFYYSNNDSLNRTVTYYVVLYNDGNTRLYIQDMQDIMPKGFTFKWVSYVGSENSSHIWNQDIADVDANSGYISRYFNTDRNIKWKTAHISTTVDTLNSQKLTFSITRVNSSSSVSYDESRGLCYLEPGEGLSFTYSCATNEYDDTQSIALNSIAMPYYDFNQGGVSVSDTAFVRKAPGNYLPNDGSCNLWDNEQASASGRTGGGNDTQWLESEVTVVRGEIKPGITKQLTAAISTSGVTTQAPIIAAHPTDTLRWTIDADNDGTMPLVDYVISDTMQAPYSFSGKVSYSILGGDSRSKTYIAAYNGYLFEILESSDEQITIRSNTNSRKNIAVNAEAVSIDVRWTDKSSYYGNNSIFPVLVQLTKNETSNAYTLSIRFSEKIQGIPENGSGVLTLETKNLSNNLDNKVFVNTSYLTPMRQTWDGSVNKGNMTTLDAQGQGDRPTVRNSSLVTTSYGYSTSSTKSVCQTDAPSNGANSNQSPNYILLPEKDKMFTYTLSVENSDKDMRSIVFIDGLPDVGDHSSFQTDDPRFSEFKVRFADDPNITVTVTLEDGSVATLAPNQYIAEFSTKTDFDKADWSGTSIWNSDSAGARALRVKISDTSGALIPAKATVSVTFNAVIDGEAEAGQIAWNSFGYHYGVVGDSAELEAAPLKVGVMIPGVPKIQKALIDKNGNSAKAVQDVTFRFLCYSGASLKLTDESQLGEELARDGRRATLIELAIPAGSSASDVLTLDNCTIYAYSNGQWNPTGETWSWENLSQYTLVELPGEDALYQFSNINKAGAADGYTFYYHSDEKLTLSATNQLDTWDFTIEKVDASGVSPLTGAWFALYSPNEADRMSSEAYDSLKNKPTEKPSDTLEYDGATWYLVQVSQTQNIENLNGALVWDGLIRDKYLYREIQAPKGYVLDDTVHITEKDDAVHNITIPNEGNGYALPKTGGFGTAWFYLLGSLMAFTSIGFFLYKRKHAEQ